jgi:hypothetical protein
MQFHEGQRLRLINVIGLHGLANVGDEVIILAESDIRGKWIVFEPELGLTLHVADWQLSHVAIFERGSWNAVWLATGWHPLASVR